MENGFLPGPLDLGPGIHPSGVGIHHAQQFGINAFGINAFGKSTFWETCSLGLKHSEKDVDP